MFAYLIKLFLVHLNNKEKDRGIINFKDKKIIYKLILKK